MDNSIYIKELPKNTRYVIQDENINLDFLLQTTSMFSGFTFPIFQKHIISSIILEKNITNIGIKKLIFQTLEML